MPNERPEEISISDELLLDWALGQLEGGALARVERALADSPELRARAEATRRSVALLDRHVIEPPDEDLADRIRARVAEAGAQTDEAEPKGARPSIFSLTELAAVAAALLLMAMLFFPPVQRMRHMERQLACEDNMRSIGTAMEHHANSHQDELPFVRLKGNWLQRDGGRRASGTAPLFLLLKSGSIRPEQLICPATDDRPLPAETDISGLLDFPDPGYCSYSFQNLLDAPGPIKRDRARPMPVLADRNPLFHQGRFDHEVSARANSFNHDRRGQNVLFVDGHIRWATTPEVGIDEDNIWLAGSRASQYVGTERQADENDSFLAP
jgi:prepilin-type processing-associated H-X9-DG protein